MIKIIPIMANGTANSNVNHFIPPCAKPQKAGADIKLIDELSLPLQINSTETIPCFSSKEISLHLYFL
jgi:hypothetical protein